MGASLLAGRSRRAFGKWRSGGVSLDHDLGDDERGTGYDVVLWIEVAVALRGFKPPRISVHSANSSARDKMIAGIQSIERMAQQK